MADSILIGNFNKETPQFYSKTSEEIASILEVGMQKIQRE